MRRWWHAWGRFLQLRVETVASLLGQMLSGCDLQVASRRRARVSLLMAATRKFCTSPRAVTEARVFDTRDACRRVQWFVHLIVSTALRSGGQGPSEICDVHFASSWCFTRASI